MTATLRVVEGNARFYRHTWRGSVISSFLTPILTLLGLGVGLGSLIEPAASPGGVPYLQWLGPGLLAAAAMQAGVGDSSYPVMAGIKWTKTYDAVLATPVGVRDLTLGHIGWVGLRLLLVTTVYMAALLAFDAVEVGSSLLAIGPSMMTGFAFSGLVMAYTAHLEDETGLSSLFRFGVVPLFLFSGTFFPVSQLPDWMEPLALLTPLWHGVELARAAAGIPGSPHLPWYIHLGFLAAFATVGVGLAVWQMRRRLVK